MPFASSTWPKVDRASAIALIYASGTLRISSNDVRAVDERFCNICDISEAYDDTLSIPTCVCTISDLSIESRAK
jgi:hypothetical protein